LNSSNKTLHRYRSNTYIAGALTLIAVGALVFLYIQIADLSERYGVIERDIEHFTTERDQLYSERGRLSGSIDKLRIEHAQLDEKVLSQKAQLEGAVEGQKIAEQGQERASKRIQELLEHERHAKDTINKAQKLHETIVGLEEKVATLGSDIQSKEQLLRSLSTDLSHKNAELDQLKGQVAGLENRRVELSTEVGDLGGLKLQVKLLKTEKKNLLSDKDELTKKREGLLASIKMLETKREQDSALLEATNTKLSSVYKILQNSTQKRVLAEEEVATIRTEILNLQSQKGDLESDAANAQARTKHAKMKLITINEQLNQLNNEVNSVAAQLAALKKKHEDIDAELATARVKHASITAEIEKRGIVFAEIERAEEQLIAQKGRLKSLENKIEDQLTINQAVSSELISKQGKLQATLESVAEQLGRKGELEQRLSNLEQIILDRTARADTVEERLLNLRKQIAENTVLNERQKIKLSEEQSALEKMRAEVLMLESREHELRMNIQNNEKLFKSQNIVPITVKPATEVKPQTR